MLTRYDSKLEDELPSLMMHARPGSLHKTDSLLTCEALCECSFLPHGHPQVKLKFALHTNTHNCVWYVLLQLAHGRGVRNVRDLLRRDHILGLYPTPIRNRLTLKPPRLTVFGKAAVSSLLLLSVLHACSRRRALVCLLGEGLLGDATATLLAASVLCRHSMDDNACWVELRPSNAG